MTDDRQVAFHAAKSLLRVISRAQSNTAILIAVGAQLSTRDDDAGRRRPPSIPILGRKVADVSCGWAN